MTASSQLISVVVPVYRDGLRALAAAQALTAQALSDGVNLEILLVDDGSDDDTLQLLSQPLDPRVRTIHLPRNMGRSAARNAGAGEAIGETLVFMDCDCLPADAHLLATHFDALRAGAVASAGHVTGSGDGFWDRYQREASLRRERQHARGCQGAGSSQNLAVSKAAFVQAGGFDAAYLHYGFEDRDLLLRLAALGRVAWSAQAVVQHLDALHLGEVAHKMAEAGEHTAGLFATRHSQAYRELGYAAIDVRTRPWLRPLGRLLGPHVQTLAERLDPLLAQRMPYPVARTVAKLMTALSFLYGTARSEASKESA
jgi:GT2 family glycosyltransferase